MTNDNETVDGPVDGPRVIFGKENRNWRPSRNHDNPGAMERRKSFSSATDEFSSAHDIGIDLQGVDKKTLIRDLHELLEDSRKRQVQGEMDAIDASIRLLDDPGDTPMDDFMDHEIELSMADIDHAESAIGYESVKKAFRQRRDRPETLRGKDLYWLIRDRLDYPEGRDDPTWRPAIEETLGYIDRIHDVLGDEWSQHSERELIDRIKEQINHLDNSVSFLEESDPRYLYIAGQRDGFQEVLSMIQKHSYENDSPEEETPVTKEKKGFFGKIRSIFSS